MTFKELSEYFSKLEATPLRNRMTEILSELFKHAGKDEIGKLCYLLQGRVAPLYEPLEFGVADKMMIRAIASGLNIHTDEVLKDFKKSGDLGKTAESIKSQVSSVKHKDNTLSIKDVYDQLYSVASSSGAGSQEDKVRILADLIKTVDPLSARYIARIPLGKLRLGFSDMTILDALSWLLSGNKEHKDVIETAYNVRPDLGYIAKSIKEKGMEGIKHVVPVIGTPILMARANRLSSAKEILEKIGKCAVEYKYDGLRLQVHFSKVKNQESRIKNKDNPQKTLFEKTRNYEIHMFSRNLEDVTEMFPDIEEAVVKQVKAHSAIIEGEVVAYNPHTGVFVPFQETMQRKRKYDISAKALEIPVKLFAFELLFCDGKNYIEDAYADRKKELKHILTPGSVIQYANETVVDDEKKIENLFQDSVSKHFEGIMAKKLEGRYEAGMRGWNWIKFKKAMSKKLMDTIDVLVMGYTFGEGKRTTFGVGQFLTGVYDKKTESFVTISKIGTGLTDEQFKEFIKRVKKLEVKDKPVNYEIDKLMQPDIWLKPSLVVEVGSDEITRSAVHTAGRVMEPSKSGKAFSVKTPGFALRFPRLINFRDDKKPEDATTVTEISDMFHKQGSAKTKNK